MIALPLCKWIFICAAPVHHGNRDLQHTEVDRQLTPVVIPVVQHDRPQQLNPRPGKGLFPIHLQAPIPARRLFTHLVQAILGGPNAFIESGVNLREILGLRRIEIRRRSVNLVPLHE